MGWFLLIFSDILRLTSLTKRLSSFYWYWLYSFEDDAIRHLSSCSVPSCSAFTSVCFWFFFMFCRSILCPNELVTRDNQKTHWRFWLTRKSIRTHLLMFIHHIVIIKLVWIIPLLSMSDLSVCLLVTLVYFLTKVLLSSPGLFPQSLLACTIRLLMSLVLHFTPLMRISLGISDLFLVSHLFDVDKKGEKAREIWRFLGVILCF